MAEEPENVDDGYTDIDDDPEKEGRELKVIPSLPEETKPAETKPGETPKTITVDGKEVPIEDVVNAYKFSASNTQKAQDLAKDREELEKQLALRAVRGKSNQPAEESKANEPEPEKPAPKPTQQTKTKEEPPELAETLARLEQLEVAAARREIREEVNGVQRRYGNDVEPSALLQVMNEKGLSAEEAHALLVGQQQLAERSRNVAETSVRSLTRTPTNIQSLGVVVANNNAPPRNFDEAEKDGVSFLRQRRAAR